MAEPDNLDSIGGPAALARRDRLALQREAEDAQIVEHEQSEYRERDEPSGNSMPDGLSYVRAGSAARDVLNQVVSRLGQPAVGSDRTSADADAISARQRWQDAGVPSDPDSSEEDPVKPEMSERESELYGLARGIQEGEFGDADDPAFSDRLKSAWIAAGILQPHDHARPAHEPAQITELDSVASSSWTGILTIAEQATIVMQVAPAALQGVQLLIDEAETRLDNYQEDAPERDALDALKSLHKELGKLISQVQSGRPIDSLQRLRTAALRCFGVASETGEFLLTGAPPAAASTLTALGAMKGCELLLGMDPTSSTAVASVAGAAMVAQRWARAKP